MMDKKKLPIGISSFREIITKNYYFIDKSLLIEELLEAGSNVTLITRPRRFGKTLNMNMLKEFFSMDTDSKEIFAGLKIMNTKYADELNKYPVLFFSFKDVKGTKADIITGIKTELLREFEKHYFLSEHNSINKFKKNRLNEIMDLLQNTAQNDLANINNCIRFLTEIIYQHYKIRPLLLIDEYDTPLISAYENKIFDELRSFFTNLYSSTLKDNEYLNFAVLTGIQRVAKENIFSGLNNLKVCTVLDARYHDKFGLTKEETGAFLEYYNLLLNKQVADMYNGYNFSGEQIFNPWSIINYADTKKLEYFWINTSSNKIIYDLVSKEDFDFADIFEEMLTMGKVNIPVDLATTFFEMPNAANFWGLMINAGYLTLAKASTEQGILDAYRIPNGEVKHEFKRLAATYTKQDPSSLERMFDALLTRNIKKFARIYQDMVMRYTSFHDYRENAYHMLFLGMSFYLEPKYEIKSNYETGHGRADIVYTAKQKGDPNLIIEFKQGADIESLAVEALEQIKTKEYYAGLTGESLLVGVAHFKKKVKVVTEMVNS